MHPVPPSAPDGPSPAPPSAAGIRRKLTSEPEDASAYLSHRYCDHRLDLPQGQAELDFSHVGMDLGASAFNMLRYGAEVSIASRFDEFYMLEMPLDGGVDIAFGNERYRSRTGQALLLSPGPRFVSRWRRGTRQAMLQIHREQLRTRLAQVSRRTPAELPVFNPVIDLRSDCGRKVQGVLSGLARLSEDGPVPQFPAEALIEGLIDTLLQNMAYRSGESLRLNRLHATPHQIRRAHEILEARHSDRLVMAEVARETGISERSLFDGFQRYYQRSPHQVLTDIRMEAARVLLRQGLTAQEAARRAGFPHPGRFSAAYRRAFGRSPLQDRGAAGG